MHAPAPAEPWRLDAHHPIHPGESYNGYVARVAAAEGHPSTFELHRIAGLDWPQRTEFGPTCIEGVPALAETLRIDPAELLTRAHAKLPDKVRTWRGAPLSRYVLELGTRRFSPASLAHSDHHRALWCLRPFPFCDESWEFLVDRCPSPHCGVVQRWYYPAGISLCDRCGEPLVGASTAEVDPNLRDRLRLAVGLLHHDPDRVAESEAALPDEVRALPPGGAFALLLALARANEPALGSRNRTIDAGVEPALLARAMADGWTLLGGWPEAFEEMATRRLAERGGRQGDGNRGATLCFLLRSWHVGAPGVTPLVTALRGRFEENARTCPDMKTVLRASGTQARRLAKLRREGRVDTVFALRGGRAVPLVAKESAERLQSTRRGSQLLEEAANVLGLPTYGVEQACSLGLLDWLEDPLPCAVRSGVRVSAAAIERLAAAIAAAASSPIEHARPVERVAMGIGGRLKPWGPLLGELLAGRIRFDLVGGDGTTAPLRRVRIHPSDVEAARALPTPPRVDDAGLPFRAGLTRCEAAEVLNVNERRIKGVLVAWPADGSGRPVVPLAELERMAAAQVSAAELAEALDLKTLGTRRVLERAGVPAVGIGFERGSASRLLVDALAPGGVADLALRVGEKPSVMGRLLRRVEVRYRPAGRPPSARRSSPVRKCDASESASGGPHQCPPCGRGQVPSAEALA